MFDGSAFFHSRHSFVPPVSLRDSRVDPLSRKLDRRLNERFQMGSHNEVVQVERMMIARNCAYAP